MKANERRAHLPRSGGARANAGSLALLLGDASERKQVSVFFADICDSTRRFAGPDPEDARSQFEPALRLMCETIEEYGGTISQFLGDGVMALFGAPVAQEDHALRACLAAAKLHHRVGATDDEHGFAVRIGIDSGEVAVGSWEASRIKHYRADGSPLHIARRLEQHAPAGGTLISPATLRLAQGNVEIARRLELDAKGFEEPLVAFELERSAVASLARRRQLASLIGRDPLLASILGSLERVRSGRLRFVGICGEAGIGKSRVAMALGERLMADGFSCCWVSLRAYGVRSPGMAVAELALALLNVAPEVDRGDAAIRAAIDRLDPGLATRHFSALADLLGLADSGEEWAGLSPGQRRRQLADALLAIFEARLAKEPLLVVIDDIFHIDRESQRLLENTLRGLEKRPLVLCGTYREAFTHRWADAPWFSEHLVGPIEDAQMHRIAVEIVGSDSTVSALTGDLVERAGGNPFYFEQMVMALIDEGTLVGSPGAYRCEGDCNRMKPPASISSVVSARVDRLPAAAKRVLECTAVLGEPIVPSRIASMTGRLEADVEAALGHVHSAGLLVAAAGAASPYRFRHSLVQEIVVASLSRPRRRQLHRAAYDALRVPCGTLPLADAALLMHHAYAGEAWAQAAESAQCAMSRAIERSANRDALNLFALGLEAVRRAQADMPSVRRLELNLRMTALGALSPLGKMDEAVTNLERAHEITRELGDLRRESGVALQLASVLWVQGQYERGLEAAAAAQASAQRSAGGSAQMAAQQARMMLRHGQGRYREALADARRVEQDFVQELSALVLLPRWTTIAAINVHVFSADSLAQLGEFEPAQQHCDTAYAKLATADHPYSHILLDFVQGSLWVAQQRYAEAVQLYEDARRRCRSQDVPTMEPPLVAGLCVALARQRHVAAALQLIEQAAGSQLDRIGGRYNAYYFPSSHAVALLEAGRFEEALERAGAALREAQRYGQRGYQAQAELLLGEISLRADRPAIAARHFGQAMAIAAECGMAQVEAEAGRGLHETVVPHGQDHG